MGCSSSSAQTLDQENRPGTKPEESHGDPLAVGNGFIAEDAQTIENQMQLPVLLDDLHRGADEKTEAVLISLEVQEDLASGKDLLTVLGPQPKPVSPVEPTPKAGAPSIVACKAVGSLQPVEEAVHVGVILVVAAEDQVLVKASEEVPAVKTDVQSDAPAVEAVVQREDPDVEAVVQSEAPDVEAVVQSEAPDVEAVVQSEAPDVEAVVQSEAPDVEAVVQSEALDVEAFVQSVAKEMPPELAKAYPNAAAPVDQPEPGEASAMVEELVAKDPAAVLALMEAKVLTETDAPANVSTAPCEFLAPAPNEGAAAGEGVAAGNASAPDEGVAAGDTAAPREGALPEKAKSSAQIKAAQLLIDAMIAAATIPEMPPLSPDNVEEATAPSSDSAESASSPEPSCCAEAASTPSPGAESTAAAEEVMEAQVSKAQVETAPSQPAADRAAPAEAPVVESTPAEAPPAPSSEAIFPAEAFQEYGEWKGNKGELSPHTQPAGATRNYS